MSFLHDYPHLSDIVPFALLISTLQMDVDSGLTMNGRSWCTIYSDVCTTKACLCTWELVLISVNERWCQIRYWSATCLVVCHIHLTVSVCNDVRWNVDDEMQSWLLQFILFSFVVAYTGNRVSFMWYTAPIMETSCPVCTCCPCRVPLKFWIIWFRKFQVVKSTPGEMRPEGECVQCEVLRQLRLRFNLHRRTWSIKLKQSRLKTWLRRVWVWMSL